MAEREILIKARLVENITQAAGGMVGAVDRLNQSFQNLGANSFAKMNVATKTFTNSQGQLQQQLVSNIRVMGQSAAETQKQQAASAKAADSTRLLGQVGSGATSQFDKLGKQIVVTRTATGELQARVKSASMTFDEHGNAIQRTNKTWQQYMGGVFSGLMMYQVVSSALRTVRQGFQAVIDTAIGLNAMLEQNRMAFTNFLGSAELADKMLKDLYKFAAVTPFEFPELVEASKRMMAFGFSAKEVIPMLTSIGNAAAGLGGGADKIDRITLALGQMAAKGKVQGGELRQLGEAGIRVMDIMTMVGEKYGKSLSEIIKMQETGALKAKDFLDAFQEYVKLKFGDMMMQQALTFKGAMTTIKDITQMTIANAFKPLFDALSKKVVNWSLYLQTDEFSREAETFKQTVADLMKTIGTLSTFITSSIQPALIYLASVVAIQLVQAFFAAGAAAGILSKALFELQFAVLRLDEALVAGKLTVGLLGVVIAAIAVGMLDYKKAHEEATAALGTHTEKEKLLAIALGEEGKAYLDLIDKIKLAKLARMPVMAPDIKGLIKDAVPAIEYIKALEAEVARLTAGLIHRAAQAAQFDQDATNREREMMALEAYHNEVYLRQSNLQAANQQLLTAAVAEYKDMFDKLIEKQVTGGEVSFDTGKKMREAFGLPLKNAGENLVLVIQTIGKKFGDLSTEAQTFISKKLGEIFDKMKLSIIGDTEALNLMLPVLDLVNQKTIEATNVKRWLDLRDAIAAGLAGIIMEGPAVQKKEVGELIPQSKIDEERTKIQKLGAEYEQQLERIARAMGKSTEKDLNWTQPLQEGSAVLIEMQADLAKISQNLTEAGANVQKWGDWNATAADRAVTGYKKVMQALGEYMAKKVLAAQLEGTITDKQAESLYKMYEKVFGVALSEEDKLALVINKSVKEFEKFGIVADAAMVGIAKSAQDAALKGKSASDAWTAGFKDWLPLVKEVDGLIKVLGPSAEVAFQALIDKVLASEDPLSTMKTGIQEIRDELSKKAPKFIPDPDDLAKVLVTKKAVPATDKLAEDTATGFMKIFVTTLGIAATAAQVDIKKTGEDIAAGLASGVMSPNAKATLDYAITTVISWLPEWARKLLGAASPSQVFADIGSDTMQGFADGIANNQAPMQSIANQIQNILKVISGISIDPRLKDAADTINSVVGAFSAGLQALADMATHTGKGTQNIEKAFADIIRIIQQFSRAGIGGDTTWLENLEKQGSAWSSVLGAFGSGIEALVKMKDYVQPARTAIDAALVDMRYIVVQLVDIANLFDISGLEAAKLLAETLSAIGDALGSCAESMAEAANFPRLIGPNPFANIADAMKRWLDGIVWLSSLYSEEGLKAARDLAETVSAIGDALGSIVDPMKAALNFPKLIGASPFANVSDALQRWIKGMIWLASQYAPEGLTAAQDFAATVSAIGDALEAITEPMAKAAKFPALIGATPFANIANAIIRWVKGMAWMFDEMARQGYSPAKAQEMAKVVGDIGSSLSSITEAMLKAVDFPVITGTAFTNIGNAIKQLIIKLSEWKDDFGDLAESVKDFAALLRDVVSPIGEIVSTVEALIKISETMAGRTYDWGNILVAVGIACEKMVLALYRWRDSIVLQPFILENIKGYSDLLQSVISPIQSIVSTTSDLVKFAGETEFTTDKLGEILVKVGIACEKMVLALYRWRDSIVLQPFILEAIKDYSKLLSDVLSPMQTAISITSSAADLSKKLEDGTVNMTTVTTVLHDVVKELIAEIKEWQVDTVNFDIGTGADNPLVAFAETLSKILAPISTAISVASSAYDLAQKLGSETENFTQVIATIDTVTRALVEQMNQWWLGATVGGGTAIGGPLFIEESMIEFAENLSKLLAPFQSIISVASGAIDLAAKVGTDLTNFNQAMVVMNSAMQQLVLQMKQWWFGSNRITLGPEVGGKLPLIEYAENLSKLLAPFQTIISVTTGMLDLVEKGAITTSKIAAAISQMSDIVRLLVREIWKLSAPIGGIVITERMTTFATALQTVLAPIQTAVEAMTALKDYVGLARTAASDMPAQIAALALDIKSLVTEFNAQLKDIVVSENVSNTATFLNNILGPIKAWLDMISQIRTYVSPGLTKIQSIKNDLVNLVKEMAKLPMLIGGTAGEVVGTELITKVGKMGESLMPLISMLQPAVDFMTTLSRWYKPAGFSNQITEFTDDIKSMIIKFAGIIITPEEINKISELGTKLLPMMQAVNEFLKIFDRIKHGQSILPKETFDAIFTNINEFIEHAANTVNWGNLGWAATQSFLDGLIRGLKDKSKISLLEEAAYSIAGKVEAALRLAWGIASPSKVFEKIGTQAISGLEKGMGDVNVVANKALSMGSFGRNTPTVTSVSITFTGDINTNSQQDLQKIVDAVNVAIGRKATYGGNMAMVSY